jgi:anti-sigma factor RsiW
MLTCRNAEELVAREADGLLSEAEVAGLNAHIAGCGACERLRAANLEVRPILAGRADRPVPPDLLPRVMRAVGEPAAELWIGAIDWRRWTEWTLPVAAGLVLVATLVGGTASQTGSVQTPAQQTARSAQSAGEGGTTLEDEGQTASTSTSVLGQATSSDEVLATMLGQGQTSTGGADER